MAFSYKKMHSPTGELTLIAAENSLIAVRWENDEPSTARFYPREEDQHHMILIEAERQLGEYFDGKRQQFALPLTFIGTDFQKKVWNALIAIPFGETRSYRQIAQQIGHSAAVRAVGAANGRNPLPIFAPCHRVIGSNGKLTGFAGGLANKAFLLRLEAGQLRV
ncbi:methylated-DNA--[protein]-cysteine S-methyltransferase [Erwinia tasmaniensis]|uniref:Methylated-DNA--protein-cysteine methyltransferase n=1 Tax=Erwinia tasmaniensis (strain DSM 17950 / CFBP 7177 / CIP 109463 / NCPPB 4357 / Et1/99) TaxID=465817 RepID=B2VBT4_ERWT9|nr:methylated-DNA--[protein]-cysteine S-methyltransferase [Erwinia tasmaniensis]CAO97335.1 Methylated-DNA-(Protein)-cysteine S-methyltransferase [Erwinia tasmaniensis Et1/99]